MHKIVLAGRIHFSQGRYIRGLCGGRRFLTVASCDPMCCRKGVGLVPHMCSWTRIEHQYNKKSFETSVKKHFHQNIEGYRDGSAKNHGNIYACADRQQ